MIAKTPHIESSFKYLNEEIKHVELTITVEAEKGEEQNQHELRYEPIEDGKTNEVKEVEHVVPRSWKPDRTGNRNTIRFNAQSHRIREIMKVKKIAENRVEDEGLKIGKEEE